MSKYLQIVLLAASLLYTNYATAQYDDDENEFRQYTSWGVAWGPNITNYNLKMDSGQEVPDRVSPSIGAEAGIQLDYHISEVWGVELSTSANMEHIVLHKNDMDPHLLTFGLDIAVLATTWHTKPLNGLQLGLGPYTHFVMANMMTGSTAMANPYTRVVGINPRTNEPTFALGNFNAGLELAAALDFNYQWAVRLEVKYGITDLLTTDIQRMYVRPLKVALMAYYKFNTRQ
ncbi:MAG: PorT family protein [Bacteroidales bacterium]|nr:PorT family protein [Bacteroidales bacterium]